MKKISLVLVGASGLVAAPCHLNAIAGVDSIELVGICDSNVEPLARLAEQYSAPHIYANLEQVLLDKQVDAVDLVVPPALHYDFAIAAANAGKHVYVEKPMAHTVGQAGAMIAAAESAGVTLMVGESYWFHSPHQRAAELIADGEVGDVLQVRQTKGPWLFTSEEDERLGGKGHDVAWRHDPEASGGGAFPWMMDHGCHLFATARLLAGNQPIECVNALSRQHGLAGDRDLRGITALTWNYEGDTADGVWTQTEHGPAAGPYVGFRSEVIGTKGSLLVFGEGGGAAPGFPDLAPVTLLQDGDMISYDIDETPDRAWQSNNNYYDQAHQNTLSEFAAACIEKRAPAYSAADGLHDLTATLAVIRSASEGRAITLAQMQDDWRAAVVDDG